MWVSLNNNKHIHLILFDNYWIPTTSWALRLSQKIEIKWNEAKLQFLRKEGKWKKGNMAVKNWKSLSHTWKITCYVNINICKNRRVKDEKDINISLLKEWQNPSANLEPFLLYCSALFFSTNIVETLLLVPDRFKVLQIK